MGNIDLVNMALELLPPDRDERVPFGTSLRYNKEAASRYKEAYGEDYDLLISMYEESILAANKFLIMGLTALCRGDSDEQKEKEQS